MKMLKAAVAMATLLLTILKKTLSMSLTMLTLVLHLTMSICEYLWELSGLHQPHVVPALPPRARSTSELGWVRTQLGRGQQSPPNNWDWDWRDGSLLVDLIVTVLSSVNTDHRWQPDSEQTRCPLDRINFAFKLAQQKLGVLPTMTPHELAIGNEPGKLEAYVNNIHRAVNQHHFSDSPLNEDNLTKKSVRVATATGPGLQTAIVNHIVQFSVLLPPGEKLDLLLEIHGEAGDVSFSTHLTPQSPKKHDLELTPMTGTALGTELNKHLPVGYRISWNSVLVWYRPPQAELIAVTVVSSGKHVHGSPFSVSVSKNEPVNPINLQENHIDSDLLVPRMVDNDCFATPVDDVANYSDDKEPFQKESLSEEQNTTGAPIDVKLDIQGKEDTENIGNECKKQLKDNGPRNVLCHSDSGCLVPTEDTPVGKDINTPTDFRGTELLSDKECENTGDLLHASGVKIDRTSDTIKREPEVQGQKIESLRQKGVHLGAKEIEQIESNTRELHLSKNGQSTDTNEIAKVITYNTSNDILQSAFSDSYNEPIHEQNTCFGKVSLNNHNADVSVDTADQTTEESLPGKECENTCGSKPSPNRKISWNQRIKVASSIDQPDERNLYDIQDEESIESEDVQYSCGPPLVRRNTLDQLECVVDVPNCESQKEVVIHQRRKLSKLERKRFLHGSWSSESFGSQGSIDETRVKEASEVITPSEPEAPTQEKTHPKFGIEASQVANEITLETQPYEVVEEVELCHLDQETKPKVFPANSKRAHKYPVKERKISWMNKVDVIEVPPLSPSESTSESEFQRHPKLYLQDSFDVPGHWMEVPLSESKKELEVLQRVSENVAAEDYDSNIKKDDKGSEEIIREDISSRGSRDEYLPHQVVSSLTESIGESEFCNKVFDVQSESSTLDESQGQPPNSGIVPTTSPVSAETNNDDIKEESLKIIQRSKHMQGNRSLSNNSTSSEDEKDQSSSNFGNDYGLKKVSVKDGVNDCQKGIECEENMPSLSRNISEGRIILEAIHLTESKDVPLPNDDGCDKTTDVFTTCLDPLQEVSLLPAQTRQLTFNEKLGRIVSGRDYEEKQDISLISEVKTVGISETRHDMTKGKLLLSDESNDSGHSTKEKMGFLPPCIRNEPEIPQERKMPDDSLCFNTKFTHKHLNEQIELPNTYVRRECPTKHFADVENAEEADNKTNYRIEIPLTVLTDIPSPIEMDENTLKRHTSGGTSDGRHDKAKGNATQQLIPDSGTEQEESILNLSSLKIDTENFDLPNRIAREVKPLIQQETCMTKPVYSPSLLVQFEYDDSSKLEVTGPIECSFSAKSEAAADFCEKIIESPTHRPTNQESPGDEHDERVEELTLTAHTKPNMDAREYIFVKDELPSDIRSRSYGGDSPIIPSQSVNTSKQVDWNPRSCLQEHGENIEINTDELQGIKRKECATDSQGSETPENNPSQLPVQCQLEEKRFEEMIEEMKGSNEMKNAPPTPVLKYSDQYSNFRTPQEAKYRIQDSHARSKVYLGLPQPRSRPSYSTQSVPAMVSARATKSTGKGSLLSHVSNENARSASALPESTSISGDKEPLDFSPWASADRNIGEHHEQTNPLVQNVAFNKQESLSLDDMSVEHLSDSKTNKNEMPITMFGSNIENNDSKSSALQAQTMEGPEAPIELQVESIDCMKPCSLPDTSEISVVIPSHESDGDQNRPTQEDEDTEKSSPFDVVGQDGSIPSPEHCQSHSDLSDDCQSGGLAHSDIMCPPQEWELVNYPDNDDSLDEILYDLLPKSPVPERTTPDEEILEIQELEIISEPLDTQRAAPEDSVLEYSESKTLAQENINPREETSNGQKPHIKGISHSEVSMAPTREIPQEIEATLESYVSTLTMDEPNHYDPGPGNKRPNFPIIETVDHEAQHVVLSSPSTYQSNIDCKGTNETETTSNKGDKSVPLENIESSPDSSSNRKLNSDEIAPNASWNHVKEDPILEQSVVERAQMWQAALEAGIYPTPTVPLSDQIQQLYERNHQPLDVPAKRRKLSQERQQESVLVAIKETLQVSSNSSSPLDSQAIAAYSNPGNYAKPEELDRKVEEQSLPAIPRVNTKKRSLSGESGDGKYNVTCVLRPNEAQVPGTNQNSSPIKNSERWLNIDNFTIISPVKPKKKDKTSSEEADDTPISKTTVYLGARTPPNARKELVTLRCVSTEDENSLTYVPEMKDLTPEVARDEPLYPAPNSVSKTSENQEKGHSSDEDHSNKSKVGSPDGHQSNTTPNIVQEVFTEAVPQRNETRLLNGSSSSVCQPTNDRASNEIQRSQDPSHLTTSSRDNLAGQSSLLELRKKMLRKEIPPATDSAGTRKRSPQIPTIVRQPEAIPRSGKVNKLKAMFEHLDQEASNLSSPPLQQSTLRESGRKFKSMYNVRTDTIGAKERLPIDTSIIKEKSKSSLSLGRHQDSYKQDNRGRESLCDTKEMSKSSLGLNRYRELLALNSDKRDETPKTLTSNRDNSKSSVSLSRIDPLSPPQAPVRSRHRQEERTVLSAVASAPYPPPPRVVTLGQRALSSRELNRLSEDPSSTRLDVIRRYFSGLRDGQIQPGDDAELLQQARKQCPAGKPDLNHSLPLLDDSSGWRNEPVPFSIWTGPAQLVASSPAIGETPSADDARSLLGRARQLRRRASGGALSTDLWRSEVSADMASSSGELARPDRRGVVVFGPGMCSGEVAAINRFQLYVPDPEDAPRSVQVYSGRADAMTGASLRDLQDGYHQVAYWVSQPGWYRVFVCMGGQARHINLMVNTTY